MIRKLFGAAALGLLLFSMPAAHADETPVKPLFPDLISVDGTKSPVAPSIGDGKWTVVMVWATTCQICAIDKPLYSDFYEKHKDSNITVFGISIDGIDKEPAVQKYLAKRDVAFPNSVGDFSTVSSSVMAIADEAVRGTPTYLLFNPQGEIVGVQAGHLNPEKVEQFIASSS